MNDLALAQQAAGGCRTSFAALIERYYDRIYRLSWRICGSRTLAEDNAQDVCVKLAKAIGGFRGEAAFSTWVWRITLTTASDTLRSSRRTVSVEPAQMLALADTAAMQIETPSPEDAVFGAELWEAVRALPPQQRNAVLLVYGEDMSHAEAASILGCREKTVSWHLHAAKKTLKSRLQSAV